MVCDNYLEQRKNAARERFKDHTATAVGYQMALQQIQG